MKRRFADADDWRSGYAARRIQAGVVKARDDDRIALRVFADFGYQPRHGKCFVVIAFNAYRPAVGVGCGDNAVAASDRTRRRFNFGGHGGGGVGVYDEDVHVV